jgi:succinate dehydrogenase hydrophobic anchor subunit
MMGIEIKFQVNMPMRVAGISFVFLFIAFFIYSLFNPNSTYEWSELPSIAHLIILGCGICLSVLNFAYTYYSWKLDTNEYVHWFQAQLGGDNKWSKIWLSFFPKEFIFWGIRLISPIGLLFGFAISYFAMIALAKSFI